MTEQPRSIPAPGESEKNDCCCGPRVIGPLTYHPLVRDGQVATQKDPVARLSSSWRIMDYLGAIGVRLGIRRMNYAVEPGLYALGTPHASSPVAVTANYKLTVDTVRRAWKGLDLWLLVLDTKGVNVWCAAGKGTFGTMEIVRRIGITGLPDIVSNRTLIVPQLGAPGVAAHMVKAFSDFNVIYGPVRASDMPRYLADNRRATADMRRVRFTATDRLTVAWLELSMALKAGLLVSFAILLLGLIGFQLPLLAGFARTMPFLIGFLWAAIVSGTLLSAIFLPFLPGRAFSVRGGILGALVALALIARHNAAVATPFSLLTSLSLILAAAAISAYLALNFTGASTFTSLSGVQKEIRLSLPVLIGMMAAASLLQIIRIIL